MSVTHSARAMEISSATFKNNQFLKMDQANMACGGKNISPDLKWTGVPPAAKSLALVMHDPDAPRPHGFYHWIIVDIPTRATGLPEGGKFLPPAGEVVADAGEGYAGPCPPVGGGAHHYNFTIYAMDVESINLTNPDSYEIEQAIKSHSIGSATITGLSERKPLPQSPDPQKAKPETKK